MYETKAISIELGINCTINSNGGTLGKLLKLFQESNRKQKLILELKK